MAEDIVDDLREAICNSIPYVNTNVVQAAIDGDFSNSPQWIWRNHENGVVGFGRWPDDPDAAPYIRADLICAALARMSTEHALGFKAGIEAAAGEVGRYMRLGRAGGDLAHAITSLPTPPSPLPEILEVMRPFAKIAKSYPDECGDDYRVAFDIDGMGKFYEHWTVGDLRTIAVVFDEHGGDIDAD